MMWLQWWVIYPLAFSAPAHCHQRWIVQAPRVALTTAVPSTTMGSNISLALQAFPSLSLMSRRRGGAFFTTWLLAFCVHATYETTLTTTGKGSATRYWRPHWSSPTTTGHCSYSQTTYITSATLTSIYFRACSCSRYICRWHLAGYLSSF